MYNENLLLRYGNKHISLEEYKEEGGFQALEQISGYAPDRLIEELGQRKLVGRGGAAFPTAKKWEMVACAAGEKKYVVCNSDEGEPGTCKDRMILECVPYAVIEGMILAAYAVGAEQGYIFLRGEYYYLKNRIEMAVEDVRKAGYLGEGIVGIKDFSFNLSIVISAGAYVCGEETALLNALEGKRGEPRLRPPYPSIAGLNQCPTVINNTETFAQAAVALRMDKEEYLSMGDAVSGGTKLITLTGMVRNPGVYEIPLGRLSVKTLIEDPEYGGGIISGQSVQFYQLGGQSGMIGFPEQIYTPYGYDTLSKVGLSVGSGSIAVYDTSVSPIDYCWKVLEFFANESCGKCIPCRLGGTYAKKLLEDLNDRHEVLPELLKVIDFIENSAACGLGQNIGKAIKSFLKFRGEFFYFDEYIQKIGRDRHDLRVD